MTKISKLFFLVIFLLDLLLLLLPFHSIEILFFENSLIRNELSTTTVKRVVVQQILTRLDLEPYTNRLAKNLSGGNKRKLSVAIALFVSNQILCLDEPSTGMDPSARRAMWRIIKTTTP